MINNIGKKQKIIIVISLLLFVVLIVISSLIYTNNINQRRVDVIDIKNFESTIEDIPKNERLKIRRAIFITVQLNKPDASLEEVGEAVIRDGTFQSRELDNGKVVNGTFISDIPNMKYSFRVIYSYEKNPKKGQKSPAIDGQSIYVRCLPKEDLIYPDFNCKDINTEQLGDLDPLASRLPINRLDYNIKGLYDDNNKLSLRVKFNPAFNDESSQQTKNEYMALYKKSVLNWISSQGANPDDYQISWSHDDNGNPIPGFVY